MISGRKKVFRLLRRRLTLLVIPHHAASPCRFNVSVAHLLLAGGLLVLLLGGTGRAFFGQSEYRRLRAGKEQLEREKLVFYREMIRVKGMVEELRVMHESVRDINSELAGIIPAAAGYGGFSFSPDAGDIYPADRRYPQGVSGLAGQVGELRDGFAAMRTTPLLWPLEGNITSPFGHRTNPFSRRREFHSGIDLAAPAGTPIVAPADGVVKQVTWNAASGNLLVIAHQDGLETRYAHCQRILVRRGEPVGRGQQIALVGSTGLSTGPHLHYEVRRDGRPLNPRRFMVFRAGAGRSE